MSGFGDGDGVVDGTTGRDGVGVGFVGVGVGLGDAEGLAVGDGDARCGAANGVAGRFASARCMKSLHICAGNDAPTTAIPRTLFMALNEPAYPFQTTAVSSGV